MWAELMFAPSAPFRVRWRVRAAWSSAQAETRPAEHGSLLRGVLALGEIESAEAFCRQVLDDRLHQSGAFLNATEYEDALSFLIAEAWQLHGRYDPEKGSRFSTFAYRVLSRRVASWYRQRFTDTHYRARPTLVSLEDNDAELGELLLEESSVFWRINVRALTPDGRMTLAKIARPMVEERADTRADRPPVRLRPPLVAGSVGSAARRDPSDARRRGRMSSELVLAGELSPHGMASPAWTIGSGHDWTDRDES
jgi:Sigma-70 region 2